jgi:hypothetical protein
VENGADYTRRYHGKVMQVFGWDKTAYVVMQLAHTVPAMDQDDDDEYNALDNHCEAVKFTSQGIEDSEPSYSYYWLELNLPEVEANVHLTQFMPDFRRLDVYFVNVFDDFNVTRMGDVQREQGALSDVDIGSMDWDNALEFSDAESDVVDSSQSSEPLDKWRV